MTWLEFVGSTARSLTMFLYAAFALPASAPPGRNVGFGANARVHGPESVLSAWYQTPRRVAAQTRPWPSKRSALMVVLSSSVPPTRSEVAKEPEVGLVSR